MDMVSGLVCKIHRCVSNACPSYSSEYSIDRRHSSGRRCGSVEENSLALLLPDRLQYPAGYHARDRE